MNVMGYSLFLDAVEARPSVTSISVHLHIENTTLSTTGALPFCHLTSTQEGSMKQPSLFPDHPNTRPESMVSDRQMVALIEVMSQIVKAFFERAREGESDAE